MIDVAGPPLATIGMVEEAVLFIIQNDSTAPLALATALLLNYLVTVVDPAALNGPFLSPFARLSFAGKMPARSRCWRPRSRRWSRYPTPNSPSRSGPRSQACSRSSAARCTSWRGFGNLGESQRYDPATRSVTGRPVGWQLTGFLSDNLPGDGWDDLLGYYQGRSPSCAASRTRASRCAGRREVSHA